jgi:hypothetical protein
MVRRPCNDGPESRYMIFRLNSPMLADQKRPHAGAQNMQPR